MAMNCKFIPESCVQLLSEMLSITTKVKVDLFKY